jgi:hypothetical protein
MRACNPGALLWDRDFGAGKPQNRDPVEKCQEHMFVFCSVLVKMMSYCHKMFKFLLTTVLKLIITLFGPKIHITK